MKYIIFLFVFLPELIHSQSITDKKFGFATSFNSNIGLGNNFINKGYKEFSGYSIQVSHEVINNFSAGLEFNKTNAKVIDKALIGEFDKGKKFNLIPFLSYSHDFGIEKYSLQHRFGIGITEISHDSPFGKYKVSGTCFKAGTQLNYNLNNSLKLFLSTDFIYYKYNVDIEGPYKRFYQNAIQFSPSLGLSFHL